MDKWLLERMHAIVETPTDRTALLIFAFDAILEQEKIQNKAFRKPMPSITYSVHECRTIYHLLNYV